ncbi:MAG: carboxypeptidase regulatory-like domain-containing protein [Myxococcales bacterium]|nr:carboxypeptidase regulatory-like domain-containing protein [Myxococcales bacterium]
MRRNLLSCSALITTLLLAAPSLAQDVDADAEPSAAKVKAAPRGGGNLLGHRGIVRTLAAKNHPAGLIALGADLQFFRASGFLAQNQNHSRLVNTYSVTWAPLSFLEAAFALHVITDNSTQAGVDELQVAVGDPQLSIKGGYDFGLIAIGGAFDLRFPSGAGFFEAAGSATSLRFALLASLERAGFAAHVNVGIAVDSSENLFDDPSQLTPAQRYAAQISSFNRVLLRVGAEYDIKYVAPFLEFSLEPYVGGGAPGIGKSPGILTFGARLWPTKERGLQLLAALDIGIAGVGNGTPLPIAADKYAYVLPRWNLVFRLSYRFDPFAKPKQVVRYVTKNGGNGSGGTKPAPKPGKVRGQVVDSRNSNPIAGARLRIGEDDVSELVVDPSGNFVSYGLAPGRYAVSASAEGYKPGKGEVVISAGGTAQLTLKLEPRSGIAPGTVRGKVKSVRGKVLRSATILIPKLNKTIKPERDGSFSVQLKPGSYQLIFSARGHRTQRKTVVVREGRTTVYNIELHR